jgi:hypothetical protein
MFLFSFIIETLASWSGNRQIKLYADEVKGFKGWWNIEKIDLVGNFFRTFFDRDFSWNFSKYLYLFKIFFNKF